MLILFPQYRLGLGTGWLVTAAVAGFMVRAGAAWYWPVLTILLCGFLALALAELAAANQHRKLLLILYAQGDPARFIAAYSPLLQARKVAPGQELTLRAYLSNAYLALGDSDKALELLAQAPPVTGSQAARAQALLAGNRCSIYLQRGDAAAASEQLARLRSLQAASSNAQDDLFAAIPQLTARCDLLQGRITAPGLLEQAAQDTKSPLLRADLQLAAAQIQILKQHNTAARQQLATLADGDDALWVTRQAKQLLASLPA